MKVRIDALKPGDRVRLPGGLIRTVDHVAESEFRNYRNEPIVYVIYAEGRTPEWSHGNSAIWSSEWEVVE